MLFKKNIYKLIQTISVNWNNLKMNPTNSREHSLSSPEGLNPFYHRIHLNTCDTIKIIFMSLTLAPLRLIMVGLVLLTVWPLAAIAVICRSEEDKKQPMSGWRNWIRPIIVFLCRGVFFMGGFHWITVRGKRASREEAPILAVAPHSSFLDALSLVYMDLTSVVGKTDSAKIPLFGSLIHFSQPVLVRREDPDSRINTIKEIQKRSTSGGKWPQIFIFPEGTCTNRSCLIRFKLGAFYPGVPVQPVCLRYKNKLDTITWTWDGLTAFQCFWLTLCQFQNHLEIEYLPVYKPSQEEIDNPKLFAENVRARMAECLKVPVTDHTYEDCRLMHEAGCLNFPCASSFVEFQKLHNKLGLKFEELKDLLQKYRVMDVNSSGQVTISQFALYLHLPVSPALKQVFDLFDQDKSGTIDFREYVITLSLVTAPTKFEETIKMAFQLFDVENKGHFSMESLQRILHAAFEMEAKEASNLFDEIDTDKDGKITFDEFKSYALGKPEYGKLFTTCRDVSTTNGHGHPGTVNSRVKAKDE